MPNLALINYGVGVLALPTVSDFRLLLACRPETITIHRLNWNSIWKSTLFQGNYDLDRYKGVGMVPWSGIADFLCATRYTYMHQLIVCIWLGIIAWIGTGSCCISSIWCLHALYSVAATSVAGHVDKLCGNRMSSVLNRSSSLTV